MRERAIVERIKEKFRRWRKYIVDEKKMCQRVGGGERGVEGKIKSTSDQEIKEAAVKFFFNFPGNIYVIREQCVS